MALSSFSVPAKCHCLAGLGGLLLLLATTPGCLERHFSILGYTTEPQYNRDIHTVYVPIFKNESLRRGLEFDLTRAVVREIESKTPYKVISCADEADTELFGTIFGRYKNILNRNQLNEVREAETALMVNIVWRDRRTGEVLSMPQRGPGVPPPLPAAIPIVPPTAPAGVPAVAAAPGAPPTGPVPLTPVPPPPVAVMSLATFIPELGESLTTAEKKNVDRLAVQIVSMMEKPW